MGSGNAARVPCRNRILAAAAKKPSKHVTQLGSWRRLRPDNPHNRAVNRSKRESALTEKEEIDRKHIEELVRFATGLVGPFDAQDVVTDVCLSAFGSSSWRTVANRRTYLYRSVVNHAHRSTRRRRLREQLAEDVDLHFNANQQIAGVTLDLWEP